jgi:hypothetical protein
MLNVRPSGAPCYVFDITCSMEGNTVCSPSFPSGISSGKASEVPSEAATESRCGWVMVTQLLGERHCSLRCGHHGEHYFSVDR